MLLIERMIKIVSPTFKTQVTRGGDAVHPMMNFPGVRTRELLSKIFRSFYTSYSEKALKRAVQ